MAVALRDLDHGRQPRPALRVVSPAPAPPAPPTPPAVFWRRRALVLLLVVAVAVGAVTATRAVLAGPAPAAPQVEVAVVVAEGETLWDLAGRYAPADADRAVWVTQVADRNGVDAAALQPGSSLLVPLDGASVTAAAAR